MSLKSAAFLALIGMLLLTILLVAGSIPDILNVVGGLIPVTKLMSSLIHSFALTVMVFFYVFFKAQS